MWLQEPRISVQYQTQPLSSLSPPDAQQGDSPKSQSRQWQHIFYCSVQRKHEDFKSISILWYGQRLIFDYFSILDKIERLLFHTLWIQHIHLVLKCCCVTAPVLQVWDWVIVCVDVLVSAWICFGFSGYFPSSKSMLEGGLATLNCP